MDAPVELDLDSFLPVPCTSENSEDIRKYYEEAIIDTARTLSDKEHVLRKDFSKKLDLIEQRYTELKDQFEDILLAEKNELKQKLRTEYESEMDNLRQENETLEDDVRSLRTKLHQALHNASSAPTSGGGKNHADDTCHKHLEMIAKLRNELNHKDKALTDSQKQTTDVISKMGHMRRQLEDSRKELSIREKLIVELEQKLEQAISKRSAQQKGALNGEDPNNYDQTNRKRRLEPMDSAEEIIEWKAKLDSEVEKRINGSSRDQQSRIAATNAAFDALRIKELVQTVEDLKQELTEEKNKGTTASQNGEDIRRNNEHTMDWKLEKHAFEQKIADLIDRNHDFEIKMQTKDSQLDILQQRVKQLVGELDEKVEGIRAYSEKTEIYIRQREQQQAETYEKIISTIKTEHEKELERLKIQIQEVDFRESLQAAATANLRTSSSTGQMSKSVLTEPSNSVGSSGAKRPLAYSYQAGSLDRKAHHRLAISECRLPDSDCDPRVREWVFNCDPSLEEVDKALLQQSNGDCNNIKNSALDELAHILSSKEELNRKMKGDLYDRGRNRSQSKLADKWQSFVSSVAETTRRASSLTRKPPTGRRRRSDNTPT